MWFNNFNFRRRAALTALCLAQCVKYSYSLVGAMRFTPTAAQWIESIRGVGHEIFDKNCKCWCLFRHILKFKGWYWKKISRENQWNSLQNIRFLYKRSYERFKFPNFFRPLIDSIHRAPRWGLLLSISSPHHHCCTAPCQIACLVSLLTRLIKGAVSCVTERRFLVCNFFFSESDCF